MRVLLTGNRGYIGSVLAPMLLDRGHEVAGLDSDLYSRCSFAEEPHFVPTIPLDIRDVRDGDLDGFDAVIHLAGLSNDPLGDYDARLTMEINAHASVRLGRLAKDAGVKRFLYASSCSIYGASSDRFIAEDGACAPVTPYGESKLAAEAGLRALADEDFSPTFLRASTAYGFSPRIRFDLVVNNLVAWAVCSGQIRMKSNGTPWRPIVHVQDIALAYACALEADRTVVHNRAFNVGQTSENFQVRDIAAIIGEILPDTHITFADDAGADARNYRVDCNHIARSLHSYKPQWTCRRGVEELCAAFKVQNLSIEAFEGPRFSRIAHVKSLLAEHELAPDLRRQAQMAA